MRILLDECLPRKLKTLLSGLEGVAACHARGESLPAVDVHCPLGSLPLACKTDAASIPAEIPYLRADEQHLAQWRPSIDALPGKRPGRLGDQKIVETDDEEVRQTD